MILNENIVFEKINYTPKEFKDVQVFIGDAYFNPIDGNIRYLSLTNIEEDTLEDCVFPFSYKGVTYLECTFVDGFGSSWCATSVNEETGNYITYQFCT